jgi:hypothetical protein
MATTFFTVNLYFVRISREINLSIQGLDLKIRGDIFCGGTDHSVWVVALDDTSPVPLNEYTPETQSGYIFVPPWQFEWFVDLLRNEKPVICFLDSDEPSRNTLQTFAEPVGDEEGGLNAILRRKARYASDAKT